MQLAYRGQDEDLCYVSSSPVGTLAQEKGREDMIYPSVDQLQKVLGESVFHYAKDRKKAAGRALGTLVEVVTFYLLRTWDFHRFLAIERPLPEYSNEDITHNVEYSLHPSQAICDLVFSSADLPLTVSKIVKAISAQGIDITPQRKRTHQLLSSNAVLRNACTIASDEKSFLVAILTEFSKRSIMVSVSRLFNRPFAIAECKRVGIEEGMRKGPQTIEKAKQGAYVARTVSSLQKIRLPSGEIGGVFADSGGHLTYKKYEEFVQDVIKSSSPEMLRNFILTIGVVSNHGNWFTSDNHNKELKVLAQSYDWLLFLTDQGLAEFVHDLILKPNKFYAPIRSAFLESYSGKSGSNQFTKVQMAYAADQKLQKYFNRNLKTVESWFNVIAPRKKSLKVLCSEL